MLYFLEPLFLVVNYLDQRYKAELFEQEDKYHLPMLAMIMDLVPEEAIDALSFNESNNKLFNTVVYKDAKKKNSKKF